MNAISAEQLAAMTPSEYADLYDSAPSSWHRQAYADLRRIGQGYVAPSGRLDDPCPQLVDDVIIGRQGVDL